MIEAIQNKENHFFWWMPTYTTLLIMGIFILVIYSIHEATARSMLEDDGLVQILTAVVLLASCLLCLVRALRKVSPVLHWAQLSYLLLIYAMREMDFHRLFTEEHVSRWKLYAGPFPLQDKIIGGVVVLLTLIVMLHFIGSNWGVFWRSFKTKQSWAVHVIIWAVLLFSSQVLDKSRWHGFFFEVTFEENMEFGAAIMILMILLRFPFGSQSKHS